MASAEYDEDLATLRKIYVEATPRQRYGIAQQRIANLEHGPNVLVACVSAVEGLARSLAMHVDAQARAKPGTLKSELSAVYPKYKWKDAEDLIETYLKAIGQPNPPEYFGLETWELFHYAVEYRNVLTHECTYLGQDRSPALIAACQAILHKLAAAAGLKVSDA
jgi:hypothetical protein